MKCSNCTPNLEISIFSKIPWHVIGIFPGGIVFIETKRRADVGIARNAKYQTLIRKEKVEGREPNKGKKVTHCSNSKIHHQVHSAGVDLIDGILPVGDSAKVRIDNTEIQWRVTYSALILN